MTIPYTIDKFTVLPIFRNAIEFWNSGKPYQCSTGICDFPTYGYGKLDDLGYFEFPFPSELAELDIIAAENKLRYNK